MGKRKPKEGGVTYVPLSSNKKIGTAAATYTSQESCPHDCPFHPENPVNQDSQGKKKILCYANKGNARFTTNSVNEGGAKLTPIQLARNERQAIQRGAVLPLIPWRMHVVGDGKTVAAAKELGGAAEDYISRGGGQPWTYTAAYRQVPRSAWGEAISIMASVQDAEDFAIAKAMGYSPAKVFESLPKKAFEYGGVKMIPCPHDYQARVVREWKKAKRKADKEGVPPPPEPKKPVTCVECKLCLNADKLFDRGCGIAFWKK